MKKNKWLAVLLTVSVLSLAACNKDEENGVVAPVEPPTQTTEVEKKPVEKVDEVDEKANEEVTVDEEAKTILTSTGTYLGSVDANHVKIQVGDKVAVYELITETKGVFDGVAANASVTFDYYEGTEGARVLVSILLNEVVDTKENQANNDFKKDEWLFVGMIDGHSSEFKKGDTFIVAQYGDDQLALMNELQEEDPVAVEYTVNPNGTYVLKSVTKK